MHRTYLYSVGDRMIQTEKLADGVYFKSMSEEAIKTMQGLAKTALKASGKEIRKILRADVPKRLNKLRYHIASWAYIDNRTGQPTLQVGFYSWQKLSKKNKPYSHASPHWIEFGTKPHTIKIPSQNAKRYGKILTDKTTFYGKNVNHIGQHGQHILRNSVYNNIDRIYSAQEKYLKELNATLEAAGTKIDKSPDKEESD